MCLLCTKNVHRFEIYWNNFKLLNVSDNAYCSSNFHIYLNCDQQVAAETWLDPILQRICLEPSMFQTKLTDVHFTRLDTPPEHKKLFENFH